jgi:hypothetical protein
LWPGLHGLWRYGDRTGFLIALGFAVLVNCGLVTSFIWPEVTAPFVRTACWCAAAWVWVAGAGVSYWRSPENTRSRRAETLEALFQAAQGEYLKGNWFQAEAILDRLITKDPRDADSRLMLATLYRHIRRYDAARAQLCQLERLEAAKKWCLEIELEKRWLEQQERESSAAPADSSSGENRASPDPSAGGVSRAA